MSYWEKRGRFEARLERSCALPLYSGYASCERKRQFTIISNSFKDGDYLKGTSNNRGHVR
jgi:hypothetical protein